MSAKSNTQATNEAAEAAAPAVAAPIAPAAVCPEAPGFFSKAKAVLTGPVAKTIGLISLGAAAGALGTLTGMEYRARQNGTTILPK